LWLFYHVKVQNLLKQIIYDKTEKRQVRIAAVHVLISSQPTEANLNELAELLQHETDRQVAYFIATSLKNLMESVKRCNSRYI